MKLLVVDDDRYAREGILSTLPLEKLGISNVMQTHDGKTALEIVRWFAPDIIITDICMPRMDGMEFASAVRKIQPECLLIFITGYAEIDYLKRAIELSAVAFVEKPVQADELIRAVENAAAKHQERLNTHQHTESLIKLRRQQLAALLTSNSRNMDEVRDLCNRLDFPLSGEYQCLAMKTGQPELQDVVLAVESICRKHGFEAVTELRENRQLHTVLAGKRTTDERQQLVRELLQQYPDLVIGEGMPVNALERVYESRKAACTMLDRSFYDEETRFFPYERHERVGSVLTVDVYAKFVRLLEENRAGLPSWLDALLTDIIQEKTDRVESVRSLMLSISKKLYNRYPELLGKVYGISHMSELEEYVYSVTCARQYQAFLQNVFAALEELDEATTRLAQVVRDAKSFIAERFSQPDLGLQDIAAQVNFSPAYLNVVFRTETGMTVKQYLIDCRIREARRLLRDPKVRISEIAERCGYSNANYFAKAFKELTGLTPGEYREQQL